MLAFAFAFIISADVLSYYYLRYFRNKINWSFKKYLDISSIREDFSGVLEIKNESAFPIYNLKINIETSSESDLVFVENNQGLYETSLFSKKINLPPNSSRKIELTLRGKGRGNHQWTGFDLSMSAPLSLQTLRLDYSSTNLPSFKVVPRVLKLNDLKLKSLIQGYKNTSKSLFSDESSIIGTKDYENESFRHIHWLATAKENKLLAKKYQKVQGDLYSIFLNPVGEGPFHLRRDMEDLIEYAVSVCIHLIKEGCKVELWVNYSTGQKGLLRIENDMDRSQLKKIIESLALLDSNGVFLPSSRFYDYALSKKAENSLALVIGTPPEPTARNQWIHLKI
ncbi:DUF58 domain-containing protein [Rossellomorea vietnamensis]|uniref:DUF58 domain-containing protein n=1 Tax=Rossellomorea vietnamensis TaxID=218284 RepID=UPI0014316E59|nr:DUF58 domain-containing protein [Rossellomorea vietnamensis]